MVNVLRLYVWREKRTKLLIETHQQYPDGRMRYRWLPVMEKMHPGEDPLAAAMRGIDEELMDLKKGVTLDANSKRFVIEEKSSVRKPHSNCYGAAP